MKCKALKYWETIDKKWWSDDISRMDAFIEHSDIFTDRENMLDDIVPIYEQLAENIGDTGVGFLVNGFIPQQSDVNKVTQKLKNIWGVHKCTNKQCKECSYDEDLRFNCLLDKLCNYQIAYDIGGQPALKEMIPNYKDFGYNFLYNIINTNKKGFLEAQLYGDDNMDKIENLTNTLDILEPFEQEPSVFWTDNTMYINDHSENQFLTQTTFFNAWKFSKIFDLPFDYEASDEQVLNLGKEVIDTYCDCHERNRDINVFINSIQQNLNTALGLNWNYAEWQQVKRQLISNILDDITDVENGGSATFIAKWLYDMINERIVYKKYPYPKRYKDMLVHLRNDTLQPHTYDLTKFARELKEKLYQRNTIDINGSLWVNSAKYEEVDAIVITDEEVLIKNNNKEIGCILRENINTLVEQNYESNIMVDLIENLAHLFDITKVGDL